MSTKSSGSGGKNKKSATLKEIQRIAIERQEAWERAHDLSMELYEAIEASGISPTEIASAAPISRVGIYSLKKQMKARLRRDSVEED